MGIAGREGVGGVSSQAVCTGGEGQQRSRSPATKVKGQQGARSPAAGLQCGTARASPGCLHLDGNFIFSRLLQRKETAGSWKLVADLSSLDNLPSQGKGGKVGGLWRAWQGPQAGIPNQGI